MPLDGRAFVLDTIPRKQTLRQDLAQAGINPIDPELLYKHKKEQEERHPASWSYVHREALQNWLGISLLGCWILCVTFFFLDGTSLISALMGMFTSLLTMILVSTNIPMYGPAQWQERVVGIEIMMPEAIRSVVNRLPYSPAYFTLGELKRHKTVLDPYLIAVFTVNETRTISNFDMTNDSSGSYYQEVILGIWDGDKIIAHA